MAIKLIVFAVVTAGLLYISRVSLRQRDSHGYYRFFAWEAILILILLNLENWFNGDPQSSLQMISKLCLGLSIYFVIDGIRLLHFVGKSNGIRDDDSLIGLEKTTVLVTSGLYKYILHPMYSSLLFLAWGTFCKSPSWLGGGLVIIATLLLNATAIAEETENVRYFGDAYMEYMKRAKRFIPFVY
ncbi:MAG: methyltransferase family protein [Gammaproteobacteria bacterium]